MYPNAAVTIVYKDMRTPAEAEYFYKRAQEDPGIFLTKGVVRSVESTDQDRLTVIVDDTLLGGSIALSADMVTLAAGMVSATFDPTVTSAKPAADRSEIEQLSVGKSPTLKLGYRKGEELPHLSEAFPFPDSHFICFPYESQRTGIYVAGPARAPMGMDEAERDAYGAASKAVQSIVLGGQGKAVHPRAGDQTYPEFFLQRCTQCKRCTVECPFGALDDDEKGTPKPNPTRCRRCGICMGACPERIISFKDYSIGQISSMIKALEIPDEFSGKLRALVFACENDAMPAIEMAGIAREKIDPQVRFISLRCLGSTNLVWIADALSSGIDGIMLLGCQHGADYQCHFVKGSELARTRMSKVSETLDRLMLESERVRVEAVTASDYKRIPEIINGFMADLAALEPNPYKGF
jgi:quinone-modifying oxidoreductase subunit QmoB